MAFGVGEVDICLFSLPLDLGCLEFEKGRDHRILNRIRRIFGVSCRHPFSLCKWALFHSRGRTDCR